MHGIGIKGIGLAPPMIKGRPVPYYQEILRLFGSSLVAYWPLWETSGAVVNDISGNARNGIYETVTLADGISVARKPAPLLPGTSGNANIYSASLAAAFNGAEGTFVFWAKISSAGIWTDRTERWIATIWGGGNNYFRIRRLDTVLNDWRITADCNIGGTYCIFSALISSLEWMCFGMTWSIINARVRFYANGIMPSTSPEQVPGIWSGILDPNYTRLGSAWGGGGWSGWLSDGLIASREASQEEMFDLVKYVDPSNRFTVLGDSISSDQAECWEEIVTNNKGYSISNHYAGGASIMAQMDGQVAASVNDHANIIIIELGTQDDNGGNMIALQAEVEENIAELKVSNPNALICYMNVLPRWTDNGGGTPVDKGNIRTAIAAACTAKGITCWDTFTVPWITAAQTTDGLHPTVAGHVAIAAQVLVRL